ncbi:MAG: carboxypeptidase regulatory-like domain-containing protein [Gemmatimonadaceae bacterium]|nr:carboxypeptidase regulatory-like domain-containing protein [Chitinophagaceae bacterium]
MKKSIFLFSGALTLLAFTTINFNSQVTGSVNPEDAALKAFLFSAADTLSVNVDHGNFQFTDVKPGTYNLLIEAKPPYRNEVRQGVRVVDGEPTSLGKIEMRR